MLPDKVANVKLDGPGLKVWQTRRHQWEVHRKPITEMIEDAERLPYWSVYALIAAGCALALWWVTQ